MLSYFWKYVSVSMFKKINILNVKSMSEINCISEIMVTPDNMRILVIPLKSGLMIINGEESDHQSLNTITIITDSVHVLRLDQVESTEIVANLINDREIELGGRIIQLRRTG